MNKYLILEPFSSHFSGAQKVTRNVAGILGADHCKILIRQSANNIEKHYDEFDRYYFPFERKLSLIFGKGNFDTLPMLNKLFLLFKYMFIVIMLNIYVVKICKESKIDCIYCYDPRGLILCFMFAKLFGISLVWHLHGELHISRFAQKFFSLFISRTIVPSNYIKDSIDKAFNAKVIYNGFDFNQECHLKPSRSHSHTYNLIFVGAITPQKGVHLLLESMLFFVDEDIDVSLKIVGDAVGNLEFKHWLIDFTKNELPNNVSVEFLGWRNDVPSLLAKADILCFSSLSSGKVLIGDHYITFKGSEALPTVPIEAISVGTPVLATDVAGISEIVTDGMGLILKQPVTAEDFFNALKKMYSQYSIEKEKIELHRRKFSLKKMEYEILDFFN